MKRQIEMLFGELHRIRLNSRLFANNDVGESQPCERMIGGG